VSGVTDPKLFLTYSKKKAESPNITWGDLQELCDAIEEASVRAQLPTKGILRVAINAIRAIHQ